MHLDPPAGLLLSVAETMNHSPRYDAPLARSSSRRCWRVLLRVLLAGQVAPSAVALATLAIGCSPGDFPPAAPRRNGPSEPPGAIGGALGPVRHLPPISGGSLLILHDGRTAIVADPDNDQVSVVDLSSSALLAKIALEPGDEPGRLVEDNQERVHVALRRGGAVATIDLLAQGLTVTRRPVCAAPRGIAYDPASDLVQVACAGGELVSLPAAGGKAVRELRLDRDLRDVVVEGDHLLVSRFRAAEILTVNAAGAIEARQTLPSFTPSDTTTFDGQFAPEVAWRMRSLPGGGVVVAHQRALEGTIVISPDSYASGPSCNPSIVHGTVSMLGASSGEPTASPILPTATLPVDVAVSADGSMLAVAAAGAGGVLVGPISAFAGPSGEADCNPSVVRMPVVGEPVAVAFDSLNRLVIQTRAPWTLLVGGNGSIELAPATAVDAGHATFHQPATSSSSLACASCHPEGRDDGRVWKFDPTGPRRTQSLAGGIGDTAPFHWDGDFGDDSTGHGGGVRHPHGR